MYQALAVDAMPICAHFSSSNDIPVAERPNANCVVCRGCWLSPEVYQNRFGGLWFSNGGWRVLTDESSPLKRISFCIPFCIEKQRVGVTVWQHGALPGLPSTQTFQGHVVSSMSALRRDYSMFDLVSNLPYSVLSQAWRVTVNSAKMDVMFAYSWYGVKIGIMRSTIVRYNTGVDGFRTKQFEEQRLIGYNSCTVTHTNLSGSNEDEKRFEDGRISVSGKHSWRSVCTSLNS